MSTPSKEDIIRIKIARARNTLLEAEKMLEYNFTNGAINRLYYACFYADSALLYSKDIFTKTHSGTKQMLGQHFVSPGILSNRLGKFYGEIFNSRQGYDYDDLLTADYEMVKDFSLLANEFVSTIQNLLEL